MIFNANILTITWKLSLQSSSIVTSIIWILIKIMQKLISGRSELINFRSKSYILDAENTLKGWIWSIKWELNGLMNILHGSKSFNSKDSAWKFDSLQEMDRKLCKEGRPLAATLAQVARLPCAGPKLNQAESVSSALMYWWDSSSSSLKRRLERLDVA